ncbi:uncharacterized protein LOC123566699 [Mercenaria mercenaria]|uniref:uncharacterized protein LOC123566699 n=1 Tax=Mercenaria mercenaria TaxID=6596 RepID=UPI001E1D2ABE|nr:uncharacterized protein LOC123566699 [Mercenaria mercenaria]
MAKSRNDGYSRWDTASETASETEEDHIYSCTFCLLHRKKLPAEGFCVDCDEYLCAICYKYHLRPRPTRNHTLLRKSQIPRRPGNPKVDDVLVEKCKKHRGRIVDMYCEKCDRVGCTTCMAEKHEFCHTVYIPDYNKEDDSDHFSMYHKTMEVEKEIEKVSDYKQTAELHSQNAHKQVKMYRKEINDTLDRIESNTHMKIDEKTNQALETLESYSKKLQLMETKLKQLNTHTGNKINKQFVHKKLALESYAEYELVKEEMSKELSNITEFCFKPNDKIETNLKSITTFGNICEMPPKQDKRFFLKYIHSLSAQCFIKYFPNFSAKAITYIPMCIVLTNGKLLLQAEVQFIAGSLLFLCDVEKETKETEQDSAEFKIICVKDLHNYFHDMTQVSSTKVAITLYDQKKIQYLHVHPTEMKLGTSIHVNGECCGIGCLENKLVVSFTEPKKVEIMDLQGQVLKTVSYDMSKFPQGFQFEYPHYVASDPWRKRAYVIDKYKNCILVVNVQGDITEVIWNNQDFYKTQMIYPIAAAVGEAGEVYVAVDNPYSIQKISPNFLERDYLAVKGTTWEICSIAYHDSKLYYGNRRGSFYVAEISND